MNELAEEAEKRKLPSEAAPALMDPNHTKEESIMDGWTTTMRELTADETALVSGAFTWQGLGGAMLAGGIAGGLAAAATGAGVPPGILAGMLIGGISYCITDLINQCV